MPTYLYTVKSDYLAYMTNQHTTAVSVKEVLRVVTCGMWGTDATLWMLPVCLSRLMEEYGNNSIFGK